MKRKRQNRLTIGASLNEQGISSLSLLAIIGASLAVILFLAGLILSASQDRSENLLVGESDSYLKPFSREIVYGRSVQDKEIKGYEIGYGSKAVLLIGSIHGNEMGSHDLLERFVIEMKLYPEKVSKEIKIIVIPVLNPDGLYDRTDKLNGSGVNLDLNFETKDWKEYGPEGTYAGPEPFSEPESRIIRGIVESNDVVQMISFHSRGSLVVPDNNQPSIELAEWYAVKTGYTYATSDPIEFFGFTYFGTPTTWFAEKTGNAGVTVELTDHYSSDWGKNKDALIELVSPEKW